MINVTNYNIGWHRCDVEKSSLWIFFGQAQRPAPANSTTKSGKSLDIQPGRKSILTFYDSMPIRWLAWPFVILFGTSRFLLLKISSCFSVAGWFRHLEYRLTSGMRSVNRFLINCPSPYNCNRKVNFCQSLTFLWNHFYYNPLLWPG